MKIRSKKNKIIATIMAFLMVCLFVVPSSVTNAKDNFISGFLQTIYNQNNGIGSNEVNCLYQSSSGYIWIGTDGGLFRYNGSSFQSINLWDTDRTDVYCINAIIQDADGKMWIGTDNYGLFYIEDGKNYHFQNEYYNGIKTIYDICQLEDGTIYVSSPSGLYTVYNDGDNASLVAAEDEYLQNKDFSDIEAFEGALWAICENRYIYVIKDGKREYALDFGKKVSDDINCLKAVNGKIYAGSTGKIILEYTNWNKSTVLTAGIDGINNIMSDSDGRLWVCADNGLGYFDESGFVRTKDCEIDSYLSDMIQDYEGNYWISSYRMGLLLLSRSKFVDFNMYMGMPESMVNTVYTDRQNKYIGTDDGLVIYDMDNNRIENELTGTLSGISIRDIMSDKKGNLWISTYRKFGVVKVDKDGNMIYIGRSSGLPSSVINCTLLLNDGSIAAATDSGIGIINENGEVIRCFGKEEGIAYGSITCMYQDDNGMLFAGTDGGGLYTIVMGENPEINNYTIDQGLNSNVISAIVCGEKGIWIGTDNGLCFYNEMFRSVSNIEYSNSIYDIILQDDRVWIIGSMGVLGTTEEELLGSQGVANRYFDISDGLTKPLNTISNSFIDRNGILYICCNNGICTLDTKNIPYNDVAPKIKVTSVDVDGELYEFDDLDNGLVIDNYVTKITIEFAIFSFANRDDIKVEYMLKGFDKKPIVINGNDTMKAVYTNLDGGVYEFEVNAYNGDGIACDTPLSFIINKKTSFFEDPVARAGMVGVLLLLVILMIYGAIRVKNLLVNKNKALEKLSKEHEEAVKTSSAKNDYLANMSNEIKTPINAMIAQADELMHMVSDEESKDKISSICDIGNGIIGKVDDIILLAKIEAGRIDTINAPYSVTTMIYELSEMATEKLADKSVKFFVEIGDEVVDNLIGDEDKIRNIMMRLVDNAIKYTKDGSITLSVDCYKYTEKSKEDIVNLVFTVSDTGIGIQQDRLDSIFQIYSIADNVKNNIHQGNGVGLAIAQGYAGLMGGEIEVESTYGAGATFTFTINQKVAGNMSGNQSVFKIEEMVSKEIADKLWLPDVSALLVDDDEVSRQVSLKILSRFEMKVDIASSGLSAIDMVMNNDYDVVFMDLSMPIMNGIDAMEEIHDLEGDKYTILPIVAMDSDAIEENKEKLLSCGFTDSIVKPMDVRRVAAVLKDCLPESLIKEKTNDVSTYVNGSRFSEGLEKLKEFLDVEYAIEKIGGSIDVYNKLVRMFYDQNAAASEELYKKSGKDVRGFKIKIHALRTVSMNIGALDLAHQATKMEGAINIGNREYINDNIESFLESLVDVLLAVEDYITFVDSVSGMTDEEYAMKTSSKAADMGNEEEANDKNIFEMLEQLKNAAHDSEYDSVDEIINTLNSYNLEGEDMEFIAALNEVVTNRDSDAIEELVNTYFALKM